MVLAITVFLIVGSCLYVRTEVSNLAKGLVPRETVVIDTRQDEVIKSIQQLSRLETAKYTVEKVIGASKTRKYIPSALLGDKILFIAHGEVVAGVDLSKISEKDIRVQGDRVELTLPQPQVFYSRLDNEKSYVYERSTGLFSKPDKDLESKVRATAEDQIRQAAVEDGLLEDAKQNAEQSIRSLMTSMGYSQVQISWKE